MNMKYTIYNEDCLSWLSKQKDSSVHAVVTDPPFGLKEFHSAELDKLKNRKGGIWRLPPKIGGVERAPLPRFTVLSDAEQKELFNFFQTWAREILRVIVPGGHVFVASNSLLSTIMFSGIIAGGLEPRGQIVRLVRTFRGGDRPKNAEKEFCDVSTLPRSCHEPWGLFRKSLEGTVAENLRKWGTGGVQRLSADSPMPDVIESGRTSEGEKKICSHPSLKPQDFMRTIVKSSLPLGKGIVLDPFMGGGSTIAAAEAIGYSSIGVEINEEYFNMAKQAIPKLAKLGIKEGKVVLVGSSGRAN